MSKVIIIQRKHIIFAAIALAIVLFTMLYLKPEKVIPVHANVSGERIIHMVTGEFKTTSADGKQIEAYRWDPGTVFARKGEQVTLVIHGVNGESHPFVIEGLNIKGEVQKGKETVVQFNTDKEGIYRIICLTHADSSHNGPMIGYIVVH